MLDTASSRFALNCADDLTGYRDLLIVRYGDAIRSAVAVMLGRHTGAGRSAFALDDLVQDVFVALFENEGAKLRSFEGRNDCTLETWLRTVAARRVLNYLRRPFHKDRSLNEEPIIETPYPARAADDQLISNEAARFIANAVARLPDMDRLIFRMICEDGCTYEEAAAVCRLNKGAVYTRVSRIKARLREMLEQAGFL